LFVNVGEEAAEASRSGKMPKRRRPDCNLGAGLRVIEECEREHGCGHRAL
jgi:hypothetical protein